MELIKGYESGSCSVDDEVVSEDDIPACKDQELRERAVRKVYLITYSQVELERFPTRQSFVDAVLYSFYDTPAEIVQWCCCQEQHANSGVHYHMAIKLDRNQRWLSSKRNLLERCGISVHFSSIHRNYYSAWQYVTKEDEEFIESVSHPDLANGKPPNTTSASIANTAGRRKRSVSRERGDRDIYSKKIILQHLPLFMITIRGKEKAGGKRNDCPLTNYLKSS